MVLAVGLGRVRILLAADVEAAGEARLAGVEAFGLNYPDTVPAEDRFQGHHTLFDREFLEGLGFRRVRARGQVTLMRLELGGIEGSPGWIERAARLVRSAPAAVTSSNWCVIFWFAQPGGWSDRSVN